MMMMVATVILWVSMATIVVTPVSLMIVMRRVSRPVVPGPLLIVWWSAPLSLVVRVPVTLIMANCIILYGSQVAIGSITARAQLRRWSQSSETLYTLVLPLPCIAPLCWSSKASGRVEGSWARWGSLGRLQCRRLQGEAFTGLSGNPRLIGNTSMCSP